MKFKRQKELTGSLHQIEMVPLVNILFLLLMFLLFTAGFMREPGIKVNLPKAVTSEALQCGNIELLVTNENTIYLDGSLISLPQAKALFGQLAGRKQGVLIKADRRASLGKVVEVWDIARAAGIRQINIATNQE